MSAMPGAAPGGPRPEAAGEPPRPRRRRFGVGRWLRLTLAAVLTLALLADQIWPPPLPGRSAPLAQVVLANDGTPLRAFPDREHIWRQPLRLDEVSPLYLEALIDYEDRLFWWHPGVNPWSLIGMRLRKVPQDKIVLPLIAAVKAGSSHAGSASTLAASAIGSDTRMQP